MITSPTPDPVKQQALAVLMASFVAQGHPEQYAQHMAIATIFQADLELRNAQINRLLAWLKAEHSELYTQALAQVEDTRAEFERRVQA
ncbi:MULTISPECIES: hypothetical protein [unclassified Leptolyngbya]|uniref:hypothetical protein n=1 Tax=unclassified Leptolyngbya TaxID=2650499 RepID=UPI001684D372|nr:MULTISPECIES: hypothetical protein [unclassified Leptolyngbya]MBD1912904.1 hypothetical protein [Leptolyngbya sp. FACHB-8]MBD2154767.1 hypothetical protein [Leptolyngbya sp. FACHB-16]